VLREHATHDIFVDVEAQSMRDLLRDAYTAELGIAALSASIAAMNSIEGPLGPECRMATTARCSIGK
jgi:hypothetical protein